jgi:hypothetical protein
MTSIVARPAETARKAHPQLSVFQKGTSLAPNRQFGLRKPAGPGQAPAVSRELVRSLLLAERQTALVTRCRPLNMQVEYERLYADWSRGARSEPRLRYAAVPPLSELRTMLRTLQNSLASGPWQLLYAARIDELTAETLLADAVGRSEMVHLSRQRFADGVNLAPAAELAREWLACRDEARETELIASDDLCNEHSLIRRVQAWVGRERLPFRVELSSDLVSLAATGEGFIVVARGRTLTRQDAERVAVHEVLGHALPRVRARSEEIGLFVAGSAAGNDTQEGYAVYCEQRAGVLHAARRFELGLRHVAAVSVWQGHNFAQTLELVLDAGASLALGLSVALRVYRGGGLAREGAYLPAFCAVRAELARSPELGDWLAAGRLGLPAIAALRREGYRLRSRPSPYRESAASRENVSRETSQ